MAEVYCASEPCPLFLNSTCVFYTGESLLYIGVQTNDTLEAIIVKINQAFQNTGIGYAFTNGLIQPTPSQPVQLGGALIQNTTIGGNFTLAFTGNVQAARHITTGGTSSQFVKGDGTLDSTAYQPAANYITGLSGDATASGPGVAAMTLATVNFASGTFGNGNTIPIVTVNSKGLVTNITPTPINLPPISLTFIGDVVGSGLTGSNITLLLQNVNPNPYNTITPLKFSVNGKGLVTSASPITASDIVNILGYSPSGTAGSSGTSGTTGTSGTSGVNGTSGIDGTFGTSGTSGTSGSSATSGTSGTSGSSGTAGTSGSTGTSGSSGTTGTSGSSGTTGTSGSSGTSGTTGTSGSSGTSGTTGTSGSSGLSGDRFKTTSTTTYTLQAPGNPGTLTVDPGLSYTVAQSIIIAFDANNHNEAEVTSYNSITGVINFVTFTLTGLGTYSNWFVNIDGASGGDGSSGSSGTTGTSGSSGTSGTTGTSGSSGTSGTTGTSGSSGTSGTSATDGTGGTSGTSGSSATSGTSGTSGTSATSGTSGTSGTNGGTGASGTSGTSGTSVTVSGTTNTLAKFTSSTTIGNSLFTDDGTNGAFGGANYSVGTSVRSFNISAPLYPGIGFWANNQYTGSIFSYGATGNLFLTADPSNIFSETKIVLITDGTERFAVFNNGNVTIANNPTDGGFKLDVVGAGRFSSSITANYGGTFAIPVESPASGSVALIATTSNGANDIFRWFDGSTPLGIFKNNGNILFGTTSDNGARLQVSGTSTFSAQITVSSNNGIVVGANGRAFVRQTVGGDAEIGAPVNGNLSLLSNGSSVLSFTGTGAATFSNSVTNQVTNISADGAGVVLQGYVDNNLRIAVRGSGYNSGARGGLIAAAGDFSGQVAVSTNSGIIVGAGFRAFIRQTTGGDAEIGAPAGGVLFLINNGSTALSFNGSGAATFSSGIATSGYTASTSYAALFNGNVGILTPTPNGRLAIRTQISDTPSLLFQNGLGGPSSAISNYESAAQTYTVIGTNSYVNSTANISRFSTSHAGCYIAFDEGTMVFGTGDATANPASRMNISPSGTVNFLVTTRSPNYGLQRVSAFRGGLYTYDAITGSGSDYGVTIFSEGGAGSGNIYFCPNGSATRIMTINTSSNVLIGTTTDNGDKLLVSGNTTLAGRVGVNSGSISGISLVVYGQNNGSADFGLVVRNSSGSALFSVRNDGAIFTGSSGASPYNNTTGSSANMYVFSDGGLYRSTASSQRFKENITDYAENGLDIILALKPKEFTYKKDYYNFPERKFLGLIAEEVEQVSHYLVDFTNEDGSGDVENVRYANIVVPLIKAIQEIKAENDLLKSRLDKNNIN